VSNAWNFICGRKLTVNDTGTKDPFARWEGDFSHIFLSSSNCQTCRRKNERHASDPRVNRQSHQKFPQLSTPSHPTTRPCIPFSSIVPNRSERVVQHSATTCCNKQIIQSCFHSSKPSNDPNYPIQVESLPLSAMQAEEPPSSAAGASSNSRLLPACPASPPPDAVWTLERILNNPPTAPRKRHPPRHRRSFSNIPIEVLSAWPTDDEGDDGDDRINLSVSSPSSFNAISSSDPVGSVAAYPLRPVFRIPPRITSLQDPPAGQEAHPLPPASRRPLLRDAYLFQHHSTSQLYARPAPKRKHPHPFGMPEDLCDPKDTTATSHSNALSIQRDSPWMTMEEEDRQGSTRHLLERARRPSPPDSPRI
jgi:hypothetical protein